MIAEQSLIITAKTRISYWANAVTPYYDACHTWSASGRKWSHTTWSTGSLREAWEALVS